MSMQSQGEFSEYNYTTFPRFVGTDFKHLMHMPTRKGICSEQK